MKKIWMVLAIAAVFCMGLTACGNNAEDDEEVVGGDWRTWGEVVDSELSRTRVSMWMCW